MKFYTSEKSDFAASRKWEPCAAATLAAAKRVATRRQMFQGTCVAVAVKMDEEQDGGYEQVAFTHLGKWHHCHCMEAE